MGVGSAQPHLQVGRAHRKPRHPLFHDKCGYAPTGPLFFVGNGHGRKHLGTVGVGNKLFGSVQYPVITVGHGTGADIGRIRSGIGFRQGKGRRPFTRSDAGQIRLFLFIRAVVEDPHRTDAVARADTRTKTGVGPGDLFVDDDFLKGCQAQPAIGFRDRHPE